MTSYRYIAHITRKQKEKAERREREKDRDREKEREKDRDRDRYVGTVKEVAKYNAGTQFFSLPISMREMSAAAILLLLYYLRVMPGIARGTLTNLTYL